MKTRIILTGILKDNDLFLIVKRNENDDLYPGAWEFPGGHLEDGETLKAGLRRELEEEIDFIVNVDSSKINVKLSPENCDYRWVTKDSDYLDKFVKDKLSNI